MKKSIIIVICAIAIIAIWAFVGMNSSSSLNIKNEVAKMYKLDDLGKKDEAKKIHDNLMNEVDKLENAGKGEEAFMLLDEILREMDNQHTKRIEMKKSDELNK